MSYRNDIDIQIFSGVMDSDTQGRLVIPGNYRYLLNGWNGINEGNFGAIEDAAGNIEIVNPYLPVGTNKVIGAFEDVKNNTIIFATWNSTGKHGWYRWFADRAPYANGVIEQVWQVFDPTAYSEFYPDPLNFGEYRYLTGIDLVENTLFWVDGTEPKSIDLTKAQIPNKKYRYNIYLNPVNFYQQTTYALNLYDTVAGVVVIPIIVTSFSQVRSDRVQAFITALRNNGVVASYMTVQDRGEYFTIQCEFPSVNYISLTETTLSNPSPQSISAVVPDNFYPDLQINNFTTPWGALDAWAFKAAKSTGTCAPETAYNKNYNLYREGIVLAHVAPTSFNIPSVIPGSYYINIGSDNDSSGGYYDNSGTFTLDNSTQSTLASTPPNSFWTSNFNSQAVTATIRLNISISFIAGGGQFTGILYFEGFPASYSGTQYVIPLTGQLNTTIEFTDILTFPNSDIAPRLVIVVTGASVGSVLNVTFSDGYIAYDSSVLFSRIDLNQPYIFRSKYIYEHYEQSVYSSISDCASPVTYEENCIAVDFTDKRLFDPKYAWAIRDVVLAVSNDNGLTWFDFVTLSPPDFNGIGNQRYYFTSQEQLIAVSPAEAALNYHALPVKAESQAYIGERVWYGGITEGYDKILPVFNFNPQYKLLTDPSLYPSAEIYDGTQISLVFGSFWKRGWYGYIGIVYDDDFDRSSPVNISDNSRVKIRFFSEPNPVTGTQELDYAAIVSWEIYHEPPEGVSKYQFVRTDNLQHGEYLEIPGVCTQVDDNFNPVTFGTGTYTEIDVSALTAYNAQGNVLEFTYVQGDFVRFIELSTGVPAYHEFRLEKVINDKAYILVSPDATYGIPNGTHFMEFFTPVGESATDLVYREFGACYEIGVGTFNGVTKRYHKGETQDQSYGTSPNNIVTPATGTFGYGLGNAFYRVVGGNTVNRPTISDRNAVSGVDNGRVNSDALIGRQYRPTAWRFSDEFISSTKINGLNAFQPLNDKQYNSIYGLMNKMIVQTNDILKLLFANGWQVEVYVKQSRLQQSQDNPALVVDSDTVGGDSHIVQRTVSTLNPESVALNDEADVFGFDQREGVAWVVQGDGLYQISDNLQKTTFRNIGDARMRLDLSRSKCPAVYDLFRDAYIISFNSLGDDPLELPTARLDLFQLDPALTYTQVRLTVNNNVIFSIVPSGTNLANQVINATNAQGTFDALPNPDGSVQITAPTVVGYSGVSVTITVSYNDGGPKTKAYSTAFSAGREAGIDPVFTGRTIEYSKQKKGWTTYYSFVPELFGRLRNNVVSFKDGKFYLHGKGTVKNYYGIQYSRVLRMICNKDFPKNKQFMAIQLTGIGTNDAVVTIDAYEGIAGGMRTTVAASNFENKEGIQYADLLRDETTPGFLTQVEALFNGRPMLGQQCEVEFTNGDIVKSYIYSAGVKYFYSENS